MDWKSLAEGLLRWIHVVAGITWIGHLYFFNWVNAHFVATLDADTKKKVVPELAPRALYWFRWGAAFTWVTGLLLAGMVFYMGTNLWDNARLVETLGKADWSAPTLVMVLVSWLGFLVYDQVFGRIKDNRVVAGVGLFLVAAVLSGMSNWAQWSFRGYTIHLGILFGTSMAFNVWFRIWPAQQKIIHGIKNGPPADASLAAMAGTRSKHNTYMSVPLVFAMLGQHQTWAAMHDPWTFLAVVAVGWAVTFHLYGISKKVKGF